MFLSRAMLVVMFSIFLFQGVSVASANTGFGVIIPTPQKVIGFNAFRSQHSRQHELSFQQRAKITWKTLRALRSGWLATDDPTKADRMAKTSRTLGIIGISCLAGVIIPYVGSVAYLGALVLGIIAIVQGRSARKLGSKERTGETLGYITVGLWGLFLLIAAALLFLVLLTWGG